MAYIAPAAFRLATVTDYCLDIQLTTAEASDAILTAAIARISERIDQYTNDHFESVSTTYEINGSGASRLYLPARMTSITTVKTRDYAGVLTTQAATTYRLHSSLNSTGTVATDEMDWLDVIPGQYLTAVTVPWSDPDYNPGYWPSGAQTVQVIGPSGWLAVPAEIKRATALLVYNSVKPIRHDLGLTVEWTTTDARLSKAQTEPTGFPEADDILSRYRREPYLLVG